MESMAYPQSKCSSSLLHIQRNEGYSKDTTLSLRILALLLNPLVRLTELQMQSIRILQVEKPLPYFRC